MTSKKTLELASYQRKWLRSKAHNLNPVVLLGDSGLTSNVLDAIDAALLAHELIKVRLRKPEDKKAMAQSIADQSGAAMCGLVGHTVILYRPHPEEPTIALPDRD
ncbi:MAG: ribosome assembly RNA-binding protein YhbY [Myxococcales bacterium]|nr:ribosome assembly RNA-binding protein YhbY [Myxococcales bacterium]